MKTVFEKTTLFQQLVDFECLLADGFDDAVIGISSCGSPKAVYSVNKCVKILMERDKMTQEEAEEYVDFNMQGSYLGKKTPIFVNDLDE